ncbi:uncharacterized protein LOC143519648 isoform X2 [Brachyhypopomus gauderio]|uniref:uncharacterized protein LOC143519648 isoform X2 n=1 Tax=Brachyhypopomus gauderio TaxID=698409 RepID=UPI0040435063
MMKRLHHLAMTLFTLSGFLTDVGPWRVQYPDTVCAYRGSSVVLSCNYHYPAMVEVQEVYWCSAKKNKDCRYPPYVYDNTTNQSSEDFKYIGDKKSNCTLLISNVQLNYTGEYKFRFITNKEGGKWTGDPGVILQVTELSVIKSSGSGSLQEGDALNLTCNVSCTHSVPKFIWSKNSKRLNESGPVLHFPALTACDSGTYTCTLNSREASEVLHVEGICWPSWVTVLVIAGGIFVVLAMAILALIYNRRFSAFIRGNADEGVMRRRQNVQVRGVHSEETSPQTHDAPQSTEELLDDVMYATVCIKHTEPTRGPASIDQQEDNSVIYSAVHIS